MSELPGWMGCTQISTDEGCWSDTDGVDPAAAGCHTLLDGDEACTSCGAEISGRIGEGCYTFSHTNDAGETETATLLIETNPGADVCHPHTGGKGHPDVFDCDAYCKGTNEPETGQPYSSGACAAVTDFDCLGVNQATARCECAL